MHARRLVSIGTEIILTMCVAGLFWFAFAATTVPIHEMGHSLIAAAGGKETLAMHWGMDTNEWVAAHYPDARSITNAGLSADMLMGVCVMEGGSSDDLLKAQRLYELIWSGFIAMCSVIYAYIAIEVAGGRMR